MMSLQEKAFAPKIRQFLWALEHRLCELLPNYNVIPKTGEFCLNVYFPEGHDNFRMLTGQETGLVSAEHEIAGAEIKILLFELLWSACSSSRIAACISGGEGLLSD